MRRSSIERSRLIPTPVLHERTRPPLYVPSTVSPSSALDRFVTIQFFAVIYLQKFAISSGELSVSIPMIILFVGLAVMATIGRIQFSEIRFILFSVMAAFIGISQVQSPAVSITSVIFMLLLYVCMTVRWTISDQVHDDILRRFNRLMIVPAGITLAQILLTVATGDSRLINMDSFVPSSFLLPGYNYDGEFGFRSSFSRPNGFFFLEPSFASLFLAISFTIELAYWRRRIYLALYLSALLATSGATGITFLVVALPLLLLRFSLVSAIVLATVGIVMIGLLSAIDGNVPFSGRLSELSDPTTSGYGRISQPAFLLFENLTDPNRILTGDGAGSPATQLAGSAWPLVKLLIEYGIATSILFMIFQVTCIWGGRDREIKAALFFVFNFTGGYLLSPVMVIVFIMLGSMFSTPSATRRGDDA